MDELFERIYEEARSAWRFRWIGLGAAAVLAVLGWVAVFALPDRYEATASVFVDTRTALRPLLQGLTMEQDVNVQLNYVRQSLLSGDRAEQIARETGVLPAGERDPRAVAAILGGFTKRVELDVKSANSSEREREAGSIYTFKYQDGSRERSLGVAQTLLTTFVEETLGGKRAGSENAQKFLEERLNANADELRTIENRLAEFKKEHIGLMPTEQGGVVAQLETELDAIQKLENDLKVAQLRRGELAKQLRGDAVIGAAGAVGTTVGTGGDTLSKINEWQAKVDDLRLRFTDKHPDVIAALQTLADLKARREEEVAKLRSGDAAAAASSGVSANPVYQSIRQQLGTADLEIATLGGQVGQHRDKAAQLRKRVDTAPQVEAEYKDLMRDYDSKKELHNTLLQNLQKARMGERADDAGSVRFEILQPPTAPFGPVFPKRILFLSGVLAAAIAAGVALSYLLHLLGPVVGSTRGLAELTELPILGVVSSAFPQQLTAQSKKSLLRFLAAGGMLVGVCAVVLVLNHMGFRISGLSGQ
jgi:polysaccharide chain length determinant protein (PEP-CTERM system associated)